MRFYLFFAVMLCLCIPVYSQDAGLIDTLSAVQPDSVKGHSQSEEDYIAADSDTSLLTDEISVMMNHRKEVDSFKAIDMQRLNPKKAGLYSALFPGGGQIYNKQYWKLPIVYGLIGTGVGFIIYNSNQYNEVRVEISRRLSMKAGLNPRFEMMNMDQLQYAMNVRKENLDVTVLLTSLGYLLQIMDAVAYNHLKDFDITPDIAMRFKMSDVRIADVSVGVGVGVSFYIK